MIGMLLPIGVGLVILGAAVSTITVEAPPGRPQKRPLSPAAIRAWNATALVLIVAGILAAVAGASVLIGAELGVL